MKKVISILTIIVVTASVTFAQSKKIYDPSIDGVKQIKEAISKAKKQNKHVLVQVGGNWCPWCILMHKYFNETPDVKKAISDNYVFIELNTSKENRNKKALEMLEFPQRFGYPVLIVLDGKGKRLHTQSTGILEKGKWYDDKKVLGFLKGWTVKAVDPKSYK